MFNWIVSDTYQYLQPFNCVQKKKNELRVVYVINKMCLQIIYNWYMYKQDFAFNNQQWLICHKTELNLISDL